MGVLSVKLVVLGVGFGEAANGVWSFPMVVGVFRQLSLDLEIQYCFENIVDGMLETSA